MTTGDIASVNGIIFDLDGTLYRMRWFMRPLLFVSLFPLSRRLMRFMKVRERFAGVDLGAREALLGAIGADMAARERVAPEAAIRWVLDRFYPAFVATMPLQRSGRPGLSATLKLLKRRGLKLAVLSDYDAVAPRLVKLRIPTDNFDVIASCEAAGALKPSARAFVDIAASWNIPCQSILVVGDRDDTDGAAARNAGMQFLLVGDGKMRPSTVQAHSWSKVRGMLQEFAGSCLEKARTGEFTGGG